MTVVATIISRHATAHASDSFITSLTRGGNRHIEEARRTKIVAVPHWRGIMAYYGLAQVSARKWSTLNWLRAQASTAPKYADPDTFAQTLAIDLQRALRSMGLDKNPAAGIGIHFSVYEHIENYWIPELFHITNWTNTDYDTLRGDGIASSRQTYGNLNLSEPPPSLSPTEQRLLVREFLRRGGMFIFNNGDPFLFNPVAQSIFAGMRALSQRGWLASSDQARLLRQLSATPIRVVSQLHRGFSKKGRRVVGGIIHNISITPTGIYDSDTGDSP